MALRAKEVEIDCDLVHTVGTAYALGDQVRTGDEGKARSDVPTAAWRMTDSVTGELEVKMEAVASSTGDVGDDPPRSRDYHRSLQNILSFR